MSLHDFFPIVPASGGTTVLASVYFCTKMLGTLLNYCRKRDIFRLHHAERMAAIDKGVQIPTLPREFFQDDSPARSTPEFLSGCSRCKRTLVRRKLSSAT
jgi:hypothetical protein